MSHLCNQRKIFNLELHLNAFSDEQWCGKLVARGGLRPQLGPGVMTLRGPKMPKKSPMRPASHTGDSGGILVHL